jgi:RecA/RadA recombinase
MINKDKGTMATDSEAKFQSIREAVEKGTLTGPKPVALKVDLNKIVSKVRDAYGKDKSSAAQISTGASISKPTKDTDFIVWRNPDGTPSPWEKLTGIRGLPLGRVVQVAGRSNSGKSTHAMKFMKLAQDQGILVVLIDSENKFSRERFINFFKGNADNILVSSSKMTLEAGDQMEKMIHAIMDQDPTQKILIVIDSIGGLLAKNEGTDSLGENKQMAAASKDNGQLMRAIVRLMEQYKNKETNQEMIGCLLINQTYANIGAPGQKESGGQKIEFFSSLIVQLTRKGDITKTKDGIKIKTGIESRAKVSKNHLSDAEFSVSELPIVISAGDITLLSEKKIKSVKDDGEESEIEESDE